jgi:MFS family permease
MGAASSGAGGPSAGERPCSSWWRGSRGRPLNGGFILFLSFGSKLLLERGATPAGANLVVGWASLLSIATVPLGGALLDRVRRRDAVIAVGLVGPGAACGAFALGGPAALWSVLLGLLLAPVAGVVALAGEGLSPRSRSTGFGLFYTLLYAGMGLAPVAAGYLVDRSGGAAALGLAAILWLAALPALWLFRVLQRRWPVAGAATSIA